MSSLLYICDWLPPDFGAVGQYSLGFARQRAADGDEVVLAGLSSTAEWSEAEHVGAGKLTILRFKANAYDRSNLRQRAWWTAKLNLRLLWRLRKHLRQADEVLFTGSPPFLLHFLAPLNLLLRKRLIYRITDFHPECLMAGMNRVPLALKALHWLTVAWRKTIACFEVLGEDQRRRLLEIGVRPERIRLKRDPSPVSVAADTAPLARPAELAGHALLLYSGNFGVAHDHETFIEGYRLHHREGSGRVGLWLNAVGAKADLVERLLREAGLPVHRGRPVPLADLPRLLVTPDAHLITLRDAFVGYVMPSKVYGSIASGGDVLYIGSPASDVHLLCREQLPSAAYHHAPVGRADLVASALEALADRASGAESDAIALPASAVSRSIARIVTMTLLLCVCLARTAAAQSPDEEFVGPFKSWLDVKRDFGAVGDGKTDGTASLQRALNAIRQHKIASVLYLPSGTYRLTRTLRTAREAHQDNMVSIVGEDPEKVVLTWDGPQGDTMLQWNAWYAKISRITFDGAGRAGACLLYGPAFSTFNETSDLVCRDAKTGILFGKPDSDGQAENEVLRCRFVRCGTGIKTANWNSMDIWAWYCRFEDCERGIHNVMGNWHAWENLFLRSKVADVGIENLMAFSVVNNTSLGSRRFLDFDTGHTWGSPTSVTGNRVLDPTGDWAMWLSNSGPYLLVDNVLRLGNNARGVRMTWGDQTLVGNTYSRENAVEEHGRFRRMDEKVVAAGAISADLPALPPTPPRAKREIIDVPRGAPARVIQQAIDRAAKLSGRRPAVHLPMAAYTIDRTLVIPPGCDLQLIGDGASEVATRLVWAGPADGVLLRIEGPSKATIRDLQLQAPSARALLVVAPDEAATQIFADQLSANGPVDQPHGRTAALRVSGFAAALVQFRALQGSGNGGAWVEVVGPEKARNADAGERTTVGVFTGATGSAAGQYDVREGGRLVVRGVYHEKSSGSLEGLHLSDSGLLSIDATRFSYATSEKSPTFATDGFRGSFTLATCLLLPVEAAETCRFELRGDGSQTSVLALNDLFWIQKPGASADTIWINRANPSARGGLIGSNVNTNNKDAAPRGFEFLNEVGDNPDPAKSKRGSGPLPDRGGVDDATIVRHLAALRSTQPRYPGAAPAGRTDIRLHRVFATGGRGAAVEFRASK